MFAHKSLEADFENASKFIKNPNNSPKYLAKLIDSTVLKPETTYDKITALCLEARKYEFRSVCIPPAFVKHAKTQLVNQTTEVLICTVIGFPNGNNTSESKYFETQNAVDNGADEIDFVQNIGLIKSNLWENIELEYRGILAAANGKLVKIILETALLSDSEIYECAKRAALCGVHVIKTSTGFSTRGASDNDITIISAALEEIKKATGISHGIKASGGVRSFKDALNMVTLGATRLGTSGGSAIINGTENTNTY